MQWNIVSLFAKVFLSVCLIGFVVGSLLAYFATSLWITDFAYRISIQISPFVVTFVLIVMATLAIVTLQSAKAIRLNPTKVLKDE
jgi:putative ABC transport system permease protein